MLTINIDLQGRLVNGQLGIVMHIARNFKDILKIHLKSGDAIAGIKAMNADIFGKLNSWVPIEKTKVYIKSKLSKSSSPVIKRTQYLLMLAWVCTAHKVQGLPLNKIIASLYLSRQKKLWTNLCSIK